MFFHFGDDENNRNLNNMLIDFVDRMFRQHGYKMSVLS